MDFLYPSGALGSRGVVVESRAWRVVALQVQEVRDFHDVAAIGATTATTAPTALKESESRLP
jgi:hypothetical protein